MTHTILQSVGQGGVNRPDDVRLVQQLLNDHDEDVVGIMKLQVDGRIGPQTIQAIKSFQQRVLHMRAPDGRVDVGGKTLAALQEGAQESSSNATFRVVFQHHGKVPAASIAQGGIDTLYESTVTVYGETIETFDGSIYPDDLSIKGRLKDGTYPLYLGFHKRAGHTPTEDDLEARSQGFRAALVVNADRSVPVLSDNPGKLTSAAIHVHNGFQSHRYSDGCPTIHPQDWDDFIEIFLDEFPDLDDWTATSTYVGKKIGTLEVRR